MRLKSLRLENCNGFLTSSSLLFVILVLSLSFSVPACLALFSLVFVDALLLAAARLLAYAPFSKIQYRLKQCNDENRIEEDARTKESSSIPLI